MLPFFLTVVDKVASHSIGAEANGVKCAAQLGLVLGMSVEIPQLLRTMGKLTLPTVLAQTTLCEGATKFSLIA